MKLKNLISILLTAAVVFSPTVSQAGGPMIVGGPSFGTPGQPITWAQGTPIRYRIDGGPLSSTSTTTVISNSAGAARVQSMFQAWQNVSSASLDIQSAGAIQSVPSQNGSTSFTDGDVNTPTEFDAVSRSCDDGTQSPIVFDANGSLFSELGLPSAVIGFAGPCKLSNGKIVSGMAVLNGQFVDGINSGSNYELPADGFDAAFIHEFGHFLGLDHSQLNTDCYYSYPCTTDGMAGLPTMFPILMSTEQKSLAPDDIAWITALYPKGGTTAGFGKITGVVYFYDGVSHVQGVNVIARAVDNTGTTVDESRTTAVSVVSGFKFTGNPGQSVSGTNTGGSTFGSRDPLTIGYYEMLIPPGQYTVEVEPIRTEFSGGSSVGPLDPPFPMPGINEYWHSGQNNHDPGVAAEPFSVGAGQTVPNIDFILNNQYTRADDSEDTTTLLIYPDIGNRPEQSHGGAA